MGSTPVDLDPRAGPRRWGWVFAAIWMFYLLNPLEASWQKRGTIAGWVGMIATILFAAIYLGVFLLLRWRRAGTPFRITPSPTLGVVAVAVEIALAVTICVAVGQAGTATAVYIAVLSMISLPSVWGWVVAAVVACSTYAATVLVDGWESDRGILFGTLVAALAIWGISQSISRNVEMLSVREENARLALEDERNRFARDLHDILGHSLTVITVKAELAQKLFDIDPERARAEVTDLERLSRDALADVRRAVEGYRELTLPGELARARIALEAAEIKADLPNSTDDVPSSLRELFAWTIREGVTNVVRHSGARRCTVTLTPFSAEIADDGRGADGRGADGRGGDGRGGDGRGGDGRGDDGMPVGGNGLRGLRERAAACGATVVTTALNPGFSLKVVKP